MTAITVYRGARDPVPRARDELTWNQLHTEITTLCTHESDATDKRDLIALAPYRLRDGTTRAAANVEIMSDMVMLDCDGIDLAALQTRVGALGWSAIVHGSPSDVDGAELRKVRVFVHVDREHSPADAGAMRDAVAARLGVAADPATRNADRIGFCGRLRGTPPRMVWRHDGAPVVLDSLPPAAAAPVRLHEVVDAPSRPDVARDAATYGMLTALGPAEMRNGQKHALCGAVGGLLRKAQWRREDCAELIRAWLPHDDPRVDVDAGVKWACHAWDLPAEEVTGVSALVRLLGDESARTIDALAMVPWTARRAPLADTPGPPAAEPSREYATLEIVDLAADPPALRYVVRGLDLAAGKVSVIQGYAYTAKTPFALLLAICVASGRDFLGHPVVQGPVAYLDYEGGLLTQERAVRICMGMGIDRATLPLTLARADVLSEAGLDDIERLVRDRGVTTVVADTYSSAIPAEGNFNDSTVRAWATTLGQVSLRLGVMVLVLVHETKSANGSAGLRGISGHGSLAGAVQAAIALARPDEGKPNIITATCARAARRGFAPITVRWDDVPCEGAPDGQALVAVVVEAPPPKTPRVNAANDRREARKKREVLQHGRAVMRVVPPALGATRAELNSASGVGSGAAKAGALERLRDAGLLRLIANRYHVTKAGMAATPETIDEALGVVGDYL